MRSTRILSWALALVFVCGSALPMLGCASTRAQTEVQETAAPPEGEPPTDSPDPSVPDDQKPKRKPPGTPN